MYAHVYMFYLCMQHIFRITYICILFFFLDECEACMARLGVPGLNNSTTATNPLAAEWNPVFPTSWSYSPKPGGALPVINRVLTTINGVLFG